MRKIELTDELVFSAKKGFHLEKTNCQKVCTLEKKYEQVKVWVYRNRLKNECIIVEFCDAGRVIDLGRCYSYCLRGNADSVSVIAQVDFHFNSINSGNNNKKLKLSRQRLAIYSNGSIEVFKNPPDEFYRKLDGAKDFLKSCRALF